MLLHSSPKEDSLGKILSKFLDTVFSAPVIDLGFKGGCIYTADINSRSLNFKAQKDMPLEAQKLCSPINLDNSLCAQADSSKQIQFTEYIDESLNGYFPDIASLEKYCIPILDKDQLLGVMVLYLTDGHKPINSEEVFLDTAANILAGIIARCQNEEKYKLLFEQADVGIIIGNDEHYALDANKKALEILGYTFEEITSLSAFDIIHPQDLQSTKPQDNIERMESGESFTLQRRFRKKDGEYVPVEVSLKKLQGINDPGSNIIMFHDVTKRKQAEERLDYLAYYDELTGLPNRALFQDRLKQAMAKSKRLGTKVAVMLIDIDRLKSVNDTLGNLAGDSLIQEIGRRINESVREGDTVARFSGDEFMVLADNIEHPNQVQKIGERIHQKVNQAFQLNETDIYPEVSIGYTFYPDNSRNIDTLCKQANMAIDEAKKSTSNKVRAFVDKMSWISRQFYLEQELKRALENEEFILYYQPQIALNDHKKIIGVEALLRWQHPQRGLVPPGDFIPLLEKTGIILPVSEWIIKKVCHQLKSWQQSGIVLKGAVNISAQHLEDAMILKTLKKALQETKLQPELLEIELTESAIMENVEEAAKILKTLSDWQIKVALDDFGKGYSSLSYLQQLDINTIKIDKSFVLDLPNNKNNISLVQTIVTMAQNLGKKALAEGVEKEEQVQILRALGCDFAQGFLFGKPVSPDKLSWIVSSLLAQ